MTVKSRIEKAIRNAVDPVTGSTAPPKIAEAVRHAVFPGGARIRPRLCLAVAHACGDDQPDVTDGAMAALELLHCASLVHDDMPCFDNSNLRRGAPSVHAAFGEPLALLTGDALIVLAFQTIAKTAMAAPQRMGHLITIVGNAVGMPNGIVAGQAWECEPAADLVEYHRAKTGALFVGSSMAGAVAAGADPEPWRALGDHLGSAYQAADDLRDAFSTEEEIGKPVGQDFANARPNLVSEVGVGEAVSRLEAMIEAAVDSIPACAGAAQLRELIVNDSARLVPRNLSRSAA